jgi:hypothetical protein
MTYRSCEARTESSPLKFLPDDRSCSFVGDGSRLIRFAPR